MAWLIKYSDVMCFNVENLKLVTLLLVFVMCFVLYSLSFVSFPGLEQIQPKLEGLQPRIMNPYNQKYPGHKGQYFDLKHDVTSGVRTENVTGKRKQNLKAETISKETAHGASDSINTDSIKTTYNGRKKVKSKSDDVGIEKAYNATGKLESKSDTLGTKTAHKPTVKVKSKWDTVDTEKAESRPDTVGMETAHKPTVQVKSKWDTVDTEKAESRPDTVGMETAHKPTVQVKSKWDTVDTEKAESRPDTVGMETAHKPTVQVKSKWDTVDTEKAESRPDTVGMETAHKPTVQVKSKWDTVDTEKAESKPDTVGMETAHKPTVQVKSKWDTVDTEKAESKPDTVGMETAHKPTVQVKSKWDTVDTEKAESRPDTVGMETAHKPTVQVKSKWDTVDTEKAESRPDTVGMETAHKPTVQVKSKWDTVDTEKAESKPDTVGMETAHKPTVKVKSEWDTVDKAYKPTGTLESKSDTVGMETAHKPTVKVKSKSDTVGKEIAHKSTEKAKSNTIGMNTSNNPTKKIKPNADYVGMETEDAFGKDTSKSDVTGTEKLKIKPDNVGKEKEYNVTRKLKSKPTNTVVMETTHDASGSVKSKADAVDIATYNATGTPKPKTDNRGLYMTNNDTEQLKSKLINVLHKLFNNSSTEQLASKLKTGDVEKQNTMKKSAERDNPDKNENRKHISQSKSDKIYMQRTNKSKNIDTETLSSPSAMNDSLKGRFNDEGQLFTASKRTTVNCLKLFKGDTALLNYHENNSTLREKLSRAKITLYNSLKNCTNFIKNKSYITRSLSKEEEESPLAYGIVVYKDVVQVERLLRAIYQPQNVYCIHVDVKAKDFFKRSIRKVASCFDNVFIASRSINVTWASFSNLEPTLVCMKDLLKVKQWKYFINLSGQEFPLKTNKEIVQILKSLNGANSVEADLSRDYSFRWKDAGTPPHGIVPVKGSVYIAVNRQFADFAINNKIAKDFLEWTKKTMHPDEIYFNSLNFNQHLKIPGSYKGNISKVPKDAPFINRYVVWSTAVSTICYGKWVRQICIFGVRDLPKMYKTTKLFVNKFHQFYQPLALDCLEELIYNRTRDEYIHKTKTKTSYYENLDFVKNAIK